MQRECGQVAVPPPPASRREEGPARGGCTPGSARGNGCTRSSLSRLRVRIQILEMEMIRSEYPVPLRKFIETPAEITCGNCMGKVKKKTTRLERTYKDCHSTCQMLRAVAQVYWAGSNPASERSGAGRVTAWAEAALGRTKQTSGRRAQLANCRVVCANIPAAASVLSQISCPQTGLGGL